MAASPVLTVLLDNTDPAFTYNQQWTLSLEEPIWVNQTYTFSGVGLGNATLTCNFQGTAITFFGHADGQLGWFIDGTGPSYVPGGLPPQIYQPFFSAGGLSDTKHAIELLFSTQVYFDYALVVAGQTTPLQGRTLFVDDQNSAMNYSGSWVPLTDQRFTIGDGFEQKAQGNTTHQSKNVGDHVVFLFTGSSVSVFGVVQWRFRGRVSTAYILDGSPPQIVTIDSKGDSQPYTDQPDYQFFHTDLTPGNHTLVITVTEITHDQSFTLDYVSYVASFDNLTAMPTLTPADIHPWVQPPLVIPKSVTPIGAIVGAAVGGVAVLCLIALLVWWRLRRRRRAKPSSQRVEIDPSPEPADPSPNPPSYTPQMTFYPIPQSNFGGSAATGTDGSPEGTSTGGAPSTYNPSSPIGAVPRSAIHLSHSSPSLYPHETPSSQSLAAASPSSPHPDQKLVGNHQTRHRSRSSIAKSDYSVNATSLYSPASPAQAYPQYGLGTKGGEKSRS